MRSRHFPPSSFPCSGAGCRVQGAGFRDWGAVFRVQCLGFRVLDSGFRAPGSGLQSDRFRVRAEDLDSRVSGGDPSW